MSEGAAAATPKPAKKKAAKSKKPANHPKYSQMIKEAITALKERGGSSRQAILKYIAKNFKVSDEKTANAHLKLALRAGVKKGTLQQAKGTGASGSFKVVAVKEKKPAKKPKSPKKKPAAKKAKKPAAKKAKSPKKAAKPKAKKATPKKAAKPKAKKASPKKAAKPKVKKASPKKAAKPKAAKPKAATPKAAKPKRAAPKQR